MTEPVLVLATSPRPVAKAHMDGSAAIRVGVTDYRSPFPLAQPPPV